MLESCKTLLEAEDLLRRSIREVSLIGQLALTDTDIELLRGFLTSADRNFEKIEHEARISLASFLVWMGIKNYDQGSYWPQVQESLGVHGQYWQNRLSRAFHETVERHELTEFSSSALVNVAPILLHGGIPDYCLPDFFEKLLLPVLNGQIIADTESPESIVYEWSNTPSLYQTTDRPVRRFLEDGGDPASDFLGRCVEMARDYLAGNSVSGPAVGLPDRIVERFCSWMESRDSSAFSNKQSKTMRPQLIFEFECGMVKIIIPRQEIRIKDARVTISTEQALIAEFHPNLIERSSGSYIEQIESYIPPATSYIVEITSTQGSTRKWIVEGLRKEAWIAFTSEGVALHARAVPRNRVWLALSKLNETPSSGCFERINGESSWSEYVFLDIDIGKSDHLTTSSIRQIPIANSQQAEFLGTVLFGCKANGLPIYLNLPSLLIPYTGISELDRWQIILKNKTRAQTHILLLSDFVVESQDENTIIRISNAVKFAAGEYEMIARLSGVLGRGFRTEFSYLPGFNFVWTRPWYRNEDNPELVIKLPAEYTVDLTDDQIRSENLSRGKCLYAPSGSEYLEFLLRDSLDREFLIDVDIPRIRWSLREGLIGSMPAKFDSEILEKEIAALIPESQLHVRFPYTEGATARLSLEGSNQITSSVIKRNSIKFELSPFLDSIRALRKTTVLFKLSLDIDWAAPDLVIDVLRIITKWEVHHFKYSADKDKDGWKFTFFWEDSIYYKDRILRLWNVTAPWIKPIEKQIEDDVSSIQAFVSDDRISPGLFRAELTVQDEFSTFDSLLPPLLSTNCFELRIGTPENFHDHLKKEDNLTAHLSNFFYASDTVWNQNKIYPNSSESARKVMSSFLFLINENQTEQISQLKKKITFDKTSRGYLRNELEVLFFESKLSRGDCLNLGGHLDMISERMVELKKGDKVLYKETLFEYKECFLDFDGKDFIILQKSEQSKRGQSLWSREFVHIKDVGKVSPAPKDSDWPWVKRVG